MQDSSQQQPKKSKKRSSSYPSFSLEDVISSVDNLKNQLGEGPYSRDSMAVALGYKGITGSSSTKIASCVYFGLLERNGNVYSLSELSRRIINYISQEELQNSLYEAFAKPALYQKLLAEYAGKSLPLMLESILIRNYGIQQNAAKSAVTTFKESAEFVGALKNGVLAAGPSAETTPVTPDSSAAGNTDTISVQNTLPASQQATTPQVKQGFLSVDLPSGLVVSYSQNLASAFAFGVFGAELKSLDDSVTTYTKKINDDKEV